MFDIQVCGLTDAKYTSIRSSLGTITLLSLRVLWFFDRLICPNQERLSPETRNIPVPPGLMGSFDMSCPGSCRVPWNMTIYVLIAPRELLANYHISSSLIGLNLKDVSISVECKENFFRRECSSKCFSRSAFWRTRVVQ